MTVNGIPCELPGFRINSVEKCSEQLTVFAEAKSPTCCCPHCGKPSSRIHSYYTRSPQDLPSSGHMVRLVLEVRRFRCQNEACSAVTFSEQIPSVVAPCAQRSVRLTTSLRDVGLVLGGKAGAKLSKRLGMAVSPSTVLRLVRQYRLPDLPTPRVLGVDDFALRKGRVYGTLLVDDETHRPIDLLPERNAAVLQRWLQAHPGVELITRDRSTEYASGATQGAPDAVQIADRWHLLGNLQEAVERLLNRLRPQLVNTGLPPSPLSATPVPLTSYDREQRRGTKDQLKQQTSRARRYERFAQVKALHAKGYPLLRIARELQMSWVTVRKYVASEYFPDSPPTRRQRSMLDPYVPYLQQRWDEGCREAQQLWRELRQLGYPGSSRMVWLWVVLRHEQLRGGHSGKGRHPARPIEVAVSQHPVSVTLPASRRLSWILLHHKEQLDEADLAIRQRLRQLPDIELVFHLAHQFLALVRQRLPSALDPWLQACQLSGLSELVNFADTLQRDKRIVMAALQFPFSNGVTEGHVNRLKFIKRSMYGRAKFDLLRIRVLAST